MPRTPKFRLKFDGDKSKLSHFLIQLRRYMLDFGDLFADDAVRVAFVGDFLEQEAANWYVGVFDYKAPELMDYTTSLKIP